MAESFEAEFDGVSDVAKNIEKICDDLMAKYHTYRQQTDALRPSFGTTGDAQQFVPSLQSSEDDIGQNVSGIQDDLTGPNGLTGAINAGVSQFRSADQTAAERLSAE